MRGTPNEYVSYNINPAESHERFARALHLIRRAWTETRPFGWLGPLLPVPHGFDLAAARAAAARAPSHVRLQPRGRGVRSAQPYRASASPRAVPLAKSAVQHYRACARDAGGEPAAEDVIYRAMFHVADTDDEAFAVIKHAAAADQPCRPEQGRRGRHAAIRLLRR
jgi:alkanesulfonate monooxygenase SsuD/methylene tetrahydromethanopterin reductase-like flavin-dependent oxidoreductase (luciferase family)